MSRDCHFISGVCVACCHRLPKGAPDTTRRNCTGPPCPHLGPPIERDGVTIKVKCGCNGREQERPHAAHECAIYKRCLPTLIPADLAAWEAREESQLYHCCHGCDRGVNAVG